MDKPVFPLMAYGRHRIGIDGRGVTTLCACHGCPLQCRYCLNPACQRDDTPYKPMDARALYDMVAVDDLYFRATGGGVTFGGGEPLTHAPFIESFRALCGGAWRITIETSLFASPEHVALAAACADELIVDIKDMNPDIYRRYTGQDNALVIRNLEALLCAVGADSVIVRAPLIPGYNTQEDRLHSLERLKGMGVTHADAFTYRTPAP